MIKRDECQRSLPRVTREKGDSTLERHGRSLSSHAILQLTLPYCVVHGAQDVAVPTTGTEYLWKTAPSNVKAKRYPARDDVILFFNIGMDRATHVPTTQDMIWRLAGFYCSDGLGERQSSGCLPTDNC